VVWKDPEVWDLGLPFSFRGHRVCVRGLPFLLAGLISMQAKICAMKGIVMHHISVRHSAFVFFLLFVFCIGIAQSQTGTTSLRGSITDKTGGAIPGVKVTLKNAALSI
jgi:hypothetical protein